MPMPTPRNGENENEFVSRCMEDEVMARDYPNRDQRVAVCETQWRDRNKKAAERAFELITGSNWAILPDSLEQIIAVCLRANESPEAVSAKMGRPLMNSHEVSIRDGVAIIPIAGPIMRRANLFTEISGATSVETLAQDLKQALDDPAIDSIVLEIDSPGGAIAGIGDLAQMIADGRSVKPIVAHVDHLSASAGYWLASAASEIVVSESASLGSIGVIATLSTEKNPKRVEIVSSNAPFKRPDMATDAGRAEVLNHVNALADVFTAAVAKFRGVSVDTVNADFGKGGLLVGAQAVESGMADRIGTFESVIAGLTGLTKGDRYMATASKAPAAEMPEITVAFIAENHPDIANALREEGKGAVNLESAKAEAMTIGAETERARIQGVMDQSVPGCEDLIRTLAFDGKTQPSEAAMIVLKEIKGKGARTLEGIKSDSPKPLQTSDSAGGESEDFEALVKERVDSGMPRTKAISEVAYQFPKAHRAYLNRINKAQGE